MRNSTTESGMTWRALDDPLVLHFSQVDGEKRPERILWRGSEWWVIGVTRHWTTWRALPVLGPDAVGSSPVRELTAHFWRFGAQTNPAGPLLHFEVRSAGHEWRLARLALTFSVPE
ncbi:MULTISPECIES: hypothetical protein [unclassified Arthrobacter]|uniref:hypothetical protein n=1 Tax=unclassified Arthrobacter TaxID=235627 RepID=UPI0006F2EB25|nr:hypothetical protein [Arthrobacter sp. Leaf234]KQN99753.1 hypothetical protein ASF21_13220 [Arthrobacter sp. Leaf234]